MEKIYKEDYNSIEKYAKAIISKINLVDNSIMRQLFSSYHKCNIGNLKVTNIWPWNESNVNMLNLETRLDSNRYDLNDICDGLFSDVEENRARGTINIYFNSDSPCISLRKDKYNLLKIESSKLTGLENSLKLVKELGLKVSPFTIKKGTFKQKFINKVWL